MRQTKRSLDPTILLESLYKIEDSPQRWLDNVLATAADRLNLGAGVGGVLYDVADEQRARSAYVRASGAAQDWVEAGAAMHDDPEMMARIVAAYRTIDCGDANDIATHARMTKQARGDYLGALKSFGIGGEWLLNGRGTAFTGAALYLFSHDPIRWTARQRDAMESVRKHLGTALQLQQRIASAGVLSEAHAILDRRGNVQHLSERLAKANVSCDGLAQSARADSVARLARKNWGDGWSFVEYFDRDGKAFVILCRSQAEAASPQLSEREYEVVACASLGASDKEIAYSLGIAGSTVRVLLGRAASKLGAHNRRDLIARFKDAKPRGAS
jgi:DNA-binding CsgD family transcriptional regulator